MTGQGTRITLEEQQQVIRWLREKPIADVRKRSGLSYLTLAKLAKVAEQS